MVGVWAQRCCLLSELGADTSRWGLAKGTSSDREDGTMPI